MYATPISGMLNYLSALYIDWIRTSEVKLWTLLKIATANILLELLDLLKKNMRVVQTILSCVFLGT